MLKKYITKPFFSLIILIIAFSIFSFFKSQKISLAFENPRCCPTSTPCPTIIPTPTVEPTPTTKPTGEPTPTPTQETQVPTSALEPPRGGDGGGSGGGGSASAPVCNDPKPGVPILLSAKVILPNSVRLQWIKVSGANDYAIFYGLTSGNYIYGVPSTGDTDNFTINGLNRGFFSLRAVNGCQPGDPSVEIGTGGGQVLGASTMAGTGTFQENIINFVCLIGFGIIIFGVKKLATKEKTK